MSKVSNEELQRIYDDLPRFYDRGNALISFFKDVEWRGSLVKNVLNYFPDVKKILDVASGKGELTYLIKEIIKGSDVIILDYAIHMLLNSYVKTDKIQGSFCDLPFKDNSFDCVLSSFALHAANSINNAIKEMSRVSKNCVGVIAMGKSDNPIQRKYISFYLDYIQPYLAFLVGAKPKDYKFIYYIYEKIPTNSQLKSIIENVLDLKIFEEKAFGAVYLFVGSKKG
ncbi:class I SAM-dependent methyltransferase [Acidianus sp. RZ1]|uniref:class I SAM-dependent methyltransferase n=1 Tax=Acidianus sp. RZ1 TaxID=1540082 RepID=UPI0014925939|nr:class I SAM-dependent methyltransferase [Acidianus sp. RZ1]NON62581.1 class I SAM-dependent methyltransferase [Acidianus sp. RZ1]